MNRDEILNSITEIGTCEDDSSRRTQLAALHDSVSALFDNVAALEQSQTEAEEKIKNLQADNMQLFLQVGKNNKTDGPPADPEPPKRTFENLFNEKGELK